MSNRNQTRMGFSFKSMQVSNFKTLFSVLHSLLREYNLYISDAGVKIITIDQNDNGMIHLELSSKSLVDFKCDEPINVGIRAEDLQKISSLWAVDESITFTLDDTDPHNLRITTSNKTKKTTNNYRCIIRQVQVINYENAVPATFENVVQIKSSYFKTVCKNFKVLGSEYLEIQNTGSNLFFLGESLDGSKIELTVETSDSEDVGDLVLQGKYLMKYLTCFMKATVLNTQMSICMKNDYPLFLRFDIGDMGTITLVIKPLV